jgi:Ca2+/Na+ antiporter
MEASMDISHLILSIHIFTAIGLGSTLSVSAMALYKGDSQYYKPLAITLAIITFFVVATGVGTLGVLPNDGVVAFCAKMVLFLSMAAIVEYLFWQRLRPVGIEA